jgi:hypothetical protein
LSACILEDSHIAIEQNGNCHSRAQYHQLFFKRDKRYGRKKFMFVKARIKVTTIIRAYKVKTKGHGIGLKVRKNYKEHFMKNRRR